ncbi:MAG: PIN domain-containing protein [Nanoarchaeota archaeon]|nr:PIN domain-containing protein [Nanoarchaeota archaeon]
MIEKYYLDISIWIDIYEDRKGYNNKPLGEYALKLLCFIRSKNKILVISELLIKELEKFYSIEEINGMLTPFQDILQKIKVTKKQLEQANEISRQRNLPPGDVLHAILSRENNLILVTRDKHFNQLQDITKHHNPQLTIPHFKKTITQIPTTP